MAFADGPTDQVSAGKRSAWARSWMREPAQTADSVVARPSLRPGGTPTASPRIDANSRFP
jgi:hypothetical protein